MANTNIEYLIYVLVSITYLIGKSCCLTKSNPVIS